MKHIAAAILISFIAVFGVLSVTAQTIRPNRNRPKNMNIKLTNIVMNNGRELSAKGVESIAVEDISATIQVKKDSIFYPLKEEALARLEKDPENFVIKKKSASSRKVKGMDSSDSNKNRK